MAIGPLAQLALNRAMVRALREQLAALTADAQQLADRRAQEAYDAGLRRGRAAAMIGFVIGFGSGLFVAGLLMFWLA